MIRSLQTQLPPQNQAVSMIMSPRIQLLKARPNSVLLTIQMQPYRCAPTPLLLAVFGYDKDPLGEALMRQYHIGNGNLTHCYTCHR